MLHKAWNSKGEMPYRFPRSSIKFQGHTGQNITDFDPNWAFPDYRPVAAFKSLRFALLSCVCIINAIIWWLVNGILANIPWKLCSRAIQGNHIYSSLFSLKRKTITQHDDVINGNIFHVTEPLCGEFTGHRWIPRTKASDAELWCFLWFAPE